MMKTCETCQWWKVGRHWNGEPLYDGGTCHVRRPDKGWPIVKHSDFCGEYQPREADDADTG